MTTTMLSNEAKRHLTGIDGDNLKTLGCNLMKKKVQALILQACE